VNRNKGQLLILCSCGCGVFRNDPAKITGNFRDGLKDEPKFKIPEIAFAAIDRDGKTPGV